MGHFSWDIGILPLQMEIMGYSLQDLGYWDIDLMSNCVKLGDDYFEIGILGYGSIEIGILGYGSIEIGIFGMPGPPLHSPNIISNCTNMHP